MWTTLLAALAALLLAVWLRQREGGEGKQPLAASVEEMQAAPATDVMKELTLVSVAAGASESGSESASAVKDLKDMPEVPPEKPAGQEEKPGRGEGEPEGEWAEGKHRQSNKANLERQTRAAPSLFADDTLITCEDLLGRPPNSRQRRSRAWTNSQPVIRDIRLALWPLPRSIQLLEVDDLGNILGTQHRGRSGSVSLPKSRSDGKIRPSIRPLKLDASGLAFDTSGVPDQSKHEVFWSLNRHCKLLRRAGYEPPRHSSPLGRSNTGGSSSTCSRHKKNNQRCTIIKVMVEAQRPASPSSSPSSDSSSASSASSSSLSSFSSSSSSSSSLASASSSASSSSSSSPAASSFPSLSRTQEEGYELQLSPRFGSSFLRATTVHGLKRGLETLLQVLVALSASGPSLPTRPLYSLWRFAPGVSASPNAEASQGSTRIKRRDKGRKLALLIVDEPAVSWRGLMLDTARHFLPVPLIQRTLQGMAAQKLNVLHWHLTDSSSFPLMLESLPDLARRGAFSPSKTYTAADVASIVELARNLSIRVVPEIDVPAHTKSFIHGAPEVVSNCTNVLPSSAEDAANPFKCADKLALDPSNERTLELVKTVLREVATLFPDEFLHLGADEVDFRCWTTMPHIAAWMKARNTNHVETLKRFLQSIVDEVVRLGKRPILWQDAIEQGAEIPTHGVVQPWKCWGSVGGPRVKGWPTKEGPAMSGHFLAFAAVQAGAAAVQSTCWYLDWDSSWKDLYVHSADEGPLSSLSATAASAAAAAAAASASSEPPSSSSSSSSSSPSSSPPSSAAQQGLYGGEAALWTERMDFTNAECRLWPRLGAIAERLWSATTSLPTQSPASRRHAARRQDKKRLTSQEEIPGFTEQRLLGATQLLQKFFNIPVRPLTESGGSPALLSRKELSEIAKTCPLLSSQAIQRDHTDEPWKKVLWDSFDGPV